MLYGPIVGFRVITVPQVSYNNGADIYTNVPVYFQMVYNKCACSMSSFRGNSPPNEMTARANGGVD